MDSDINLGLFLLLPLSPGLWSPPLSPHCNSYHSAPVEFPKMQISACLNLSVPCLKLCKNYSLCYLINLQHGSQGPFTNLACAFVSRFIIPVSTHPNSICQSSWIIFYSLQMVCQIKYTVLSYINFRVTMRNLYVSMYRGIFGMLSDIIWCFLIWHSNGLRVYLSAKSGSFALIRAWYFLTSGPFKNAPCLLEHQVFSLSLLS